MAAPNPFFASSASTAAPAPRRTWLLALPIAALLSACGGGETPPPAPPPPVAVTLLEAKPQAVPAQLEVTAQTEGAKEVEVRARVGGILLKRNYTEGAPVKAGQVLFQIDRTPFEIALSQAQASLQDAQARAEQTSREAARLKNLVAQQAVSRKEFEDATSNAAIAQATLSAAQARVKDAELNLSYCQVSAPIAGVSGRALRSEGTLVSTGPDALLTTVVQLNPLWVRFSLADGEIAQIPGGVVNGNTVKAVELLLADGSVYPAKGKLNFAASTMDPKLGTVAFRAEFDNPAGKLLPGQFVRARLIGASRDGVFLVPQSAVMQSDAGRFVWTVGADSKAAPRPVQTAEWQGKNWVVTGGLKAGDKIIVDNLIKIRPGSAVTEKKPEPKPEPKSDAKAEPKPDAKPATATPKS